MQSVSLMRCWQELYNLIPEGENIVIFKKGINDSPTPCQEFQMVGGKNKLVWKCPYYALWSGILYRCYSEAFHKKQPTYASCYVDESWLKFSVFKGWLSKQPLVEYWLINDGDLQLDKDILFEKNKCYSASTCVLVPKYVNTALAYSKNSGLPMGITRKKNRDIYEAQCMFLGERKYLGTSPDPWVAHALWQKQKVINLTSVIELYSSSKFFNPLVVEALKKRIDRLKLDLDNGEETTHL